MPSHWGSVQLNVPSQSSPTGTQLLQAVGAAEASYRASLVKELKDKVNGFKGDEVVYMSVGDGTTSRRRIVGSAEHRVQSETTRHISSSRTMDTPFRYRSRCRPPEEAFRTF